MTYIGKNGVAAPKLKDAVNGRGLSDRKLAALYVECIKFMRIMYKTCKLVHGDLSEVRSPLVQLSCRMLSPYAPSTSYAVGLSMSLPSRRLAHC